MPSAYRPFAARREAHKAVGRVTLQWTRTITPTHNVSSNCPFIDAQRSSITESKTLIITPRQEYERILQWAGHTPESAAEQMKAFRIRWKTCPWDFNQVVAWVRLYARTDGIGASLFLIPYKKMPKGIRRKRRRGYKWDSNNFLDMWVSDNQSSADIFDEIRTLIAATARQRFKGWYIDMGVLDVLGPHLNWVALTRDFRRSQ
jgi:hypothetical protein